jgi:hypothetical protein
MKPEADMVLMPLAEWAVDPITIASRGLPPIFHEASLPREPGQVCASENRKRKSVI